MPGIDPFEAERKALQSLMGENSFFVPDLQRPFSWGEEQVEDLLHDIQAVLNASKDVNQLNGDMRHGHFLGTIVTQQEVGRNRLAILDGQQRLTCLTLLIALIVKEAHSLLTRCTSEADILRVRNVIDELQRLILHPPDGDGNRSPRLQASPEVQETLRSFVKGGNGDVPAESLAPAMNLRRAAREIQASLLTEYLNEELENQIRYFVSLRRCICEQLLSIHMTTRAGDAAFSIFESLNARGEPLAMLDLLKIWVMSEMVGHPQEEEVTQTLRGLATSRITEEKPDKFFEAYFTIRNHGKKPKASGRRREKMFSIEFRDQLLKPSEPDDRNNHELIREKIVETFRHAAQIRPLYDSVANRQFRELLPSIRPYPVSGGSHFHQSRLDALMSPPLTHTLAVPLLVRAAEEFQGKVAEMHSLVHDIERLFFRLKVIGGCHAQVFSHAYRALFEAFSDGTYSEQFRRSRFQELLQLHSPDDAFISGLTQELRYRTDGSNLAIKYFLWMIELYSTRNPPKDKTFDLSTMSIEHVFPQSGDSEMLANGEDDLHRLGNLCLLTTPENSAMGNRPFVDKKSIALGWKAQHKPMECHHSQYVFEEFDEWGTSEIEEAEDLLCSQALKIFSF